jgi:hypothetical protein
LRVAPGDGTMLPYPLHTQLFDTGPVTLIIYTVTENDTDAIAPPSVLRMETRGIHQKRNGPTYPQLS